MWIILVIWQPGLQYKYLCFISSLAEATEDLYCGCVVKYLTTTCGCSVHTSAADCSSGFQTGSSWLPLIPLSRLPNTLTLFFLSFQLREGSSCRLKYLPVVKSGGKAKPLLSTTLAQDDVDSWICTAFYAHWINGVGGANLQCCPISCADDRSDIEQGTH